MYQRVIVTLALTSLLGSLAACSSRTAAATQTTITAFDPSQSEEKALAAVDEMVTALGGAEAWTAAKQISWEVKHTVDGKLTEYFKHWWDMWNGRHRFEFLPPEYLAAPDDKMFTVAMYNLFKRSGGYVYSKAAPTRQVMSAEVKRIVALAYQVWTRDAYQLTMFHKLKDPGVKLGYAGERRDYYGSCMDGCIDITVKFDPAVGKDEYHLLLSKTSKLPEAVEKAIPGGAMGLKVLGWTDVNGLKFPSAVKNLGAEEVFNFENIVIAEPSDEFYVVPIAR